MALGYDLPDYCTPIYFHGQRVDVEVDIVAQTIGNISVDIAAQSVGNIAIDIAAQSLGTVDINIAAQAVDINIKTSGGANIIIDKLTQTAYTERRSTLGNRGDTASWDNVTGNNRRGKFFPRGCRGFLNYIGVYCRDAGAAGGTITVYISPHPGMGYVASANVTVPAGAAAGWRSATFNLMWNYDSLFIFLVGSSADIEWGYDTGTPYDAYNSTDAGASWGFLNRRFWFTAAMKGETVGDVPVSGTLNTVEIPSVASDSYSDSITVPTATETTVVEILGAGVVRRMAFEEDHSTMEFRIYIDGVMLNRKSILGGIFFKGDSLNTRGYTVSTPQIQLLVYNANGTCDFVVNIPFEFKRSFKVTAYHNTGANQIARLGVVYNRIT